MIYYKEEKKKLVIPSGFVMIPIECDEAIEQAREQGYQEGFADGSSATCDTEEGTYSLTDDFDGEETVFPSEGKTGFNKIVIVDDGYGDKKYDEGYADGIADCSGSTPCDCSSAVTEAYQSGVTEGMAEQKALLSSTAITSNGTYTSENGWNSVNVNVPHFMPAEEKTLSLVEHSTGPWEVVASYPIGMSKVTVEDNGYGQGKYDEGYAAGLADCSGSTDCSSAITEAYQSGYTAGLEACSGGTCNLESGQASLGYDWTGFTRVYPSQGYDGLSDVIVADLGYGQRKYDEGYADGHTSGYTEGYNEAITANCGSAITEAYESGVTEGQGSIFSVKVRWLSPVTSWSLDTGYYPDLFIVDESGTSHQLNYVYQQSPTLVRYNTGVEDDTPQGWIMFAEFAGYLQDGAKYIQPYQVKFPMLNNNLWNNNISGLSVEINGEVIHNWRQDDSGLDDWQFGSGAWRFTPLATVVSDTYYDATHKIVTFYIQGQVPNNN